MSKKQRTNPNKGNCRQCGTPTQGSRRHCGKCRQRNGVAGHADKYANDETGGAVTVAPATALAPCPNRHRSGVACIHPSGHWGRHEGYRQRVLITWDSVR